MSIGQCSVSWCSYCSSGFRIKYLTCLNGAGSYHLFHSNNVWCMIILLQWPLVLLLRKLSSWVYTHHLNLSLSHYRRVQQASPSLPKLWEGTTAFFILTVPWKSAEKSDSFFIHESEGRALGTYHFSSGFHPNGMLEEKK